MSVKTYAVILAAGMATAFLASPPASGADQRDPLQSVQPETLAGIDNQRINSPRVRNRWLRIEMDADGFPGSAGMDNVRMAGVISRRDCQAIAEDEQLSVVAINLNGADGMQSRHRCEVTWIRNMCQVRSYVWGGQAGSAEAADRHSAFGPGDQIVNIADHPQHPMPGISTICSIQVHE